MVLLAETITASFAYAEALESEGKARGYIAIAEQLPDLQIIVQWFAMV